MDQERVVETERLREAMENTRASIEDTVGELKHKVSEAVDWRQYVYSHPGATLGAAAVVGLLVGRWVTGRVVSRSSNGNGRRARIAPSVASLGEGAGFASGAPPASLPAGERPLGRQMRDPGGRARFLDGSWSRAGSRVENLVNRLIDEVGDTIETAAVPPLVGKIRDFFSSSRSPERGRPGYREGAARQDSGGDSQQAREHRVSTWYRDDPTPSGESRVYPGGPAGSQVHPPQSR